MDKVKLEIGNEVYEVSYVTKDGRHFFQSDEVSNALSKQWVIDGTTLNVLTKKMGHVEIPDVANEAMSVIDSEETCIKKIAKYIYDNPEIGNTEVLAAEILTNTLKEYGFEVTKGVQGIKRGEEILIDTAFVAEMAGNGDGPTVGIMLEYDALPTGHACGHNLIASSGLSAAIGLASVMDKLPGKLVVLGTPAEEGGQIGGKVPMIGGGYFDEIDVVLVTHGGDVWDTGSLWLAVDSISLHFKGQPAHAAAAPHEGRSALDAAVLFFNGIEMMREHVKEDVRMHGIISEGGLASNIVPESAKVKFSVRSLNNSYLEEVCDRVKAVAQSAAIACGVELDLIHNKGYQSTINVPTLDALVLDNAKSLGVGPISPWETLASSDVGNTSQVVPTCNLWFAVSKPGVQLHTDQFLVDAGTEEGAEVSMKAGKALAITACQLLTTPSLVEKIKEEHVRLKEQA